MARRKAGVEQSWVKLGITEPFVRQIYATAFGTASGWNNGPAIPRAAADPRMNVRKAKKRVKPICRNRLVEDRHRIAAVRYLTKRAMLAHMRIWHDLTVDQQSWLLERAAVVVLLGKYGWEQPNLLELCGLSCLVNASWFDTACEHYITSCEDVDHTPMSGPFAALLEIVAFWRAKKSKGAKRLYAQVFSWPEMQPYFRSCAGSVHAIS